MTLMVMSIPDQDVLGGLNALQTFALTLYGEARGERVEGRIGVANSIRNRVLIGGWWGSSYKDVCLKPAQFSCWSPKGGDAERRNYQELIEIAKLVRLGRANELGPILRECYWIAEGVIDNRVQDNTRKATHYITRQLWETTPPRWLVGLTPCAAIDRHVFFNNVQ